MILTPKLFGSVHISNMTQLVLYYNDIYRFTRRMNIYEFESRREERISRGMYIYLAYLVLVIMRK